MTNKSRSHHRPQVVTHITLDGRSYVILTRNGFERLSALARIASTPPPAATGTRSASASSIAKASLAKEVLRRRITAGMTQAELARLADVRLETICRIERGHQTPSTPTVARLDRALSRIELKAASRPKRGRTR